MSTSFKKGKKTDPHNYLYYKWRVDCGVFSANRMIELSPFCHDHTKKHNFQVICWAHCVILANHCIRSPITKTFQLFLPIVNHGDRHSFCRNYSKVYSQKPCIAMRTTNYTGFCCVGFCIWYIFV